MHIIKALYIVHYQILQYKRKMKVQVITRLLAFLWSIVSEQAIQ